MRLASLLAVVVASVSWAEKKTMVVSAGDCSDAALIGGAKDFREAARKLLGPDLVESEVVLDIVRPRPTRSLQDVERQIDSAKALFYGGQNERALELVERALVELERADPDARPWKATEAALVLQALVYKNLDRPKDVNEAFRRLVRIDPSIKLDPEAHAPSTIAALDAVKKEVARTRKASLSVRVESGPAATVFIDGQVMGATPLKVDLLPGSYRVSLVAGTQLSFPHRVELPRDGKLSVDLAFEGAVSRQLPLCMLAADDGAALKLAQLVTAERLIVLRNAAKKGAPPYLSGALYEVPNTKEERTGSVQPELVSNLATFLVTGREQMGVQRVDAPPPVVAVTPVEPPKEVVKTVEPPRDPPPPPADAPKEVVVAPPPVVAPPIAAVEKPSGTSVARGFGVALLIGGGVAVGGGIAVWAEGAPHRTRLAGLSPTGRLPFPDTSAGEEAASLMQQLDGLHRSAAILIAGGAGAMVAGVLTLILFPPDAPVVSVAPTPDGAVLGLNGRF